jgi:serine/threonine protein phosphatase PrpC
MASAVGDSTIVAVVDGHNGFAAAGAVLQAVRAALPDLHDASLDSGALLTATLAKAAAAIHGDSGCAAVLARIGPHRVEVCSRGDARALLVRGRRVRCLSRTSSFLGPGDDRGAADTTGVRVKSGDVLILGSDGLFDFLSGSGMAQLREAADPADPLATARSLIGCAFAGGAGDNIAVAVARIRRKDQQVRAGPET